MASFGFVADDLTGASDVLAQAHRYGLDAVLVIGDAALPTDADVVGIAGPARSLGGTAFDEHVRRDLARIAELDLEVLLYKVCSTFDSSPKLGSIGRGIELIHEQFPEHGPIPVVPAQPGFGRFTAFSHHYATYDGQIYRLDRHPVMATHPSTPMHEADLREILAEQFGTQTIPGAIQLPTYDDGTFTQAWEQHRVAGGPAFVVDAVNDTHLDTVAGTLRTHPARSTPAIVVGSGGIMSALARTVGHRTPTTSDPHRASGPVLAVSASASSVTAQQIADALDHGWVEVPVLPSLLASSEPQQLAALDAAVSAALSAGRDVVVHTTRGSDDPRFSNLGPVDPAHVGTLIGSLAARMASAGLTHDIAVFGGDTSSHALIAMGVAQLRVAEQFVTAGPICHSDDAAPVAGCRLLLKGGQVGPPHILRRFAGHLPA